MVCTSETNAGSAKCCSFEADVYCFILSLNICTFLLSTMNDEHWKAYMNALISGNLQTSCSTMRIHQFISFYFLQPYVTKNISMRPTFL
jgi:hypothetical protein